MKISLFFLINLIITFQKGLTDNMKMGPTSFPIKQKNYKILNIIPKINKSIYTQGLFFSKDSKYLFESGGLYKESKITKINYGTMEKEKQINLDDKYFGEGIAKCNNIIYQLTWKENKVLKYSYPEMEYIGEINMPSELNEGWGLCSGKKENELYATDGSSYIYKLNCDNENELEVKEKIKVTFISTPINYLNDLIYVDGFIYANIYYNKNIIKIDPKNGMVKKWYDMTMLVKNEANLDNISSTLFKDGNVLNGICYNFDKKRFIVTGKKWGNYYEIEFDE